MHLRIMNAINVFVDLFPIYVIVFETILEEFVVWELVYTHENQSSQVLLEQYLILRANYCK